MASVTVQNVRIAGIVSAVPDNERTWEDEAGEFGRDDMQRVIKNIGVTRRTVAERLCTSDLCQAAAEQLLAALGWSKDSVDALVMVTQTPDYPAPATACLLQNRMGLRTSVVAFDVNLGCSGYTYGLYVVASLLASGGLRRALLLAGDTVARGGSPHDRSVIPLFGDGGSATALEFSPNAPVLRFEMGTDGAGGPHLHTLAGGSKHRFTDADLLIAPRADGITRANTHTYMNGAEVLTFAIRVVPPTVARLLADAGWEQADVDHFVFHQASRFMLQTVARAMRLPTSSPKLVLALEGYGNTSSASIPVAISDKLGSLNERSHKLVLAGFGIGWSWCALAVELGPLYAPPVLRVPDVLHPGEMESMKEHQVVGPPVGRVGA